MRERASIFLGFGRYREQGLQSQWKWEARKKIYREEGKREYQMEIRMTNEKKKEVVEGDRKTRL